VRSELGLEPSFPEHNGAQRQRALIDSGHAIEEIFATVVRETHQTYAERVTV